MLGAGLGGLGAGDGGSGASGGGDDFGGGEGGEVGCDFLGGAKCGNRG